jgi:fibronectin-binding autotransporter adhesin
MRRAKKVVALAAVSAVTSLGLFNASAPAAGVVYTFIGTSGANWTDAAAWNPSGVPAVGDSAIVQIAGANVAINLTAPATVGQLTLGTPSGAPFTTDIGNGSTVNPLIMDNTGGANNTDSFAANANATIYSAGVAGAINVISAPLALSGVGTSASSTTNVAAASTNSLSLTGGLIIDNNNTSATTPGVTRTLQSNLLGNNTLTIGPITSRFSVTPVGGTGTVNLTNALQIGNRQDNNTAADAGTVDFTRASFGTIILSGAITNGGSVSAGGNVYNSVTQLILGQAGANNGNSLQTIVISGNNTYTGGARLFRANVVLDSDTAFGTAAVQWGGGAASGAMGFNLISTSDTRTISNSITMQRNLTIRGDHSLTLGTGVGTLQQSNASNLFNLLPAGKTLTLNYATFATDNSSGGGRAFTFDGSGKTVVPSNIINSTGTDGANGQVIKNGDGLLVLSGTANTYAQFTAANGGILEFTNAGAVGNSNSIVVTPGGAIGIDTGATVNFTHPSKGSVNLTDMIKAGAIPSTGAMALAGPDSAANLDFTTGNLADPNVVGISIGALPGGVTYTGTITPDATRGYRLGGGATLTMANANALTGARGLTVTNGGTVVLSGNNNYTGNTTIQSNYIVTQEQAAAANIGTSSITPVNPVFVMPGVLEPTTLVVNSIADGASSIGNPSDTSANGLVLQGGTLKVTGTGGTSSRLFTITPLGGTIDSSGTGSVNFSNTGANVNSDAPTTITGTTAASSNQVTAVTDVSNLTVGMTITGTNIPAATTITGIRPNFNVTSNVPGPQTYTLFISANASGVGTATALTFGNQNRTLNLTGSNVAANTIAGALSDSASGKLAINKTGAGQWVLTGNNTYTGGTTVASGTLGLAKIPATGNLSIASGATAKVTLKGTANSAAGTSVITPAQLNIATGGKLDLTNNTLVLDYTGPVGTLVGDTRTNLQSGRLTTSAASPTGARLGYGDTAVLGAGTYGGVAVDNSAVVVKFTYGGDSNLDGQVDVTDLGALATAWQTSAPWTGGDFNYDGFVDVSDLGILATNWQLGVGSPLGPGSLEVAMASVGLGNVSVPEPTSMALMGLCLAGVLGRRSRR